MFRVPHPADRGIALPLAVFALVLVGALVSGAFFVGRQEQSVGRNSVKLQQAFAAAEAGAQQTVAVWRADLYNGLGEGAAAPIHGSLGSAGWYRGEVRRLNQQLFLVRSEGFSRDSSARQHVGLLVRLQPLPIPITAALAVEDASGVPRASADGSDASPPGWDCPAGAAGVLPLGSPPDSVLARLGARSFNDLASLATQRVSGGNLTAEPALSGTSCNRSNPTNWGSPGDQGGPCGRHLPTIWSDTSLVLAGGEGQGVLIVNGDLEVRSAFRFYGLVLVRGRLRVSSSGVDLRGAVIARSASLTATPGAAATVRYSRCVLDRVLHGTARAALLRERSWINLY